MRSKSGTVYWFCKNSCLPLLSKRYSKQLKTAVWHGVCLQIQYFHNLYFNVSGNCRHFLWSVFYKRKRQHNLFWICLLLTYPLISKVANCVWISPLLILCILLEWDGYLLVGMEMVCDRSFTLTTSNHEQSWLRPLKNGVPQGSIWAPLQRLHLWLANHRLQKVCIRQRSSNRACSWNWQAVGGVLKKDMATIREYHQDLEAKVQHYKSGIGNLPTQQQGS